MVLNFIKMVNIKKRKAIKINNFSVILMLFSPNLKPQDLFCWQTILFAIFLLKSKTITRIQVLIIIAMSLVNIYFLSILISLLLSFKRLPEGLNI